MCFDQGADGFGGAAYGDPLIPMRSTQEEGGRALNSGRIARFGVRFDTLQSGRVIHASLEGARIQADLLCHEGQLIASKVALIFEQGFLHLPKLALLARALCGSGGLATLGLAGVESGMTLAGQREHLEP